MHQRGRRRGTLGGGNGDGNYSIQEKNGGKCMETIRFYTALIYLRTHEANGAKREIKSESGERGRERHHTTREEGEEHGPAAVATMVTAETMERMRRTQRRKAGRKEGRL
jgi:hypothetical protein